MSKSTKKRNKQYIPRSKKVAKPTMDWKTLGEVSLLTIEDIRRPHMEIAKIYSQFEKDLNEDPKLKEIVDGLDKSYYDCIDRCLGLMTKHVVSENFPSNHKELMGNVAGFQNAQFKSGEVGKGIEDKEQVFQEVMAYHNLHADYHELAHHIVSLSTKGAREIELRLAAKHHVESDEVNEIEKKYDDMEEQLSDAHQLLANGKNMLAGVEEVNKLSNDMEKLKAEKE